jgi:hypothetical protein
MVKFLLFGSLKNEKMKLSIEKQLPSRIAVDFDPQDEIFSVFLHSNTIPLFVKMLEALLLGHDFGGERHGVFLYDNLDAEDFATGHVFGEHEVEIYQLDFGEKILDKKYFMRTLVQYARFIMEHHEELSATLLVDKIKDLITGLTVKYDL